VCPLQAARRIVADHRLLLSGTPIQNGVLELWALFDFLMPGFLGTEREFRAKRVPPPIVFPKPKSGIHSSLPFYYYFSILMITYYP
jgi:TATA-binding protein-associated factor